jgi:hypothetical protein
MCLCSIGHPAMFRGERAGRTFEERTMGVLWRHSSFNLVKPRSIALAAANILRRLPETDIAVSTPALTPQLPSRLRCEFIPMLALRLSISH